MNKDKLIKFEEEIAELFNAGKIRAPVHLYHGNEDKIINVFKNIKADDWVFCSWRSHYQCLLKGVPEKLITEEILSGKSFLSMGKYSQQFEEELTKFFGRPAVCVVRLRLSSAWQASVPIVWLLCVFPDVDLWHVIQGSDGIDRHSDALHQNEDSHGHLPLLLCAETQNLPNDAPLWRQIVYRLFSLIF